MAPTGVLGNDTDPDGDTLTITGVSDVANGAGTLGSPLAGDFGHLTLNGDGSFSYYADRPAAIDGAASGSHPQDVFAYSEADGNGDTEDSALTVTIDRAPVLVAQSAKVLSGGTIGPAINARVI